MTTATKSVQSAKPNWFAENWLRVVTHVGALLPLAYLAWRWYNDDLGADPVNTINNFTGRTAMILLILCLACTPVYIVTGFRQTLGVRRALGLYAFMYAGIHFFNFIALDYAFDLQFILDDGVATKPYILVGLTALTCLLALALTSTKGWKRRLKKNWTRLHWLVYPAGILVMIHFFWQAKAAEKFEPLVYAAIVGVMLLVRVTPIRKWIVSTRQRLTEGKADKSRHIPRIAKVEANPNAALESQPDF